LKSFPAGKSKPFSETPARERRRNCKEKGLHHFVQTFFLITRFSLPAILQRFVNIPELPKILRYNPSDKIF
jgi:hypothetical protein